MGNVVNISIHNDYQARNAIAQNQKLSDLVTAVELVLSSPTEEQLLGKAQEKQELRKNTGIIQRYLAQTKISVDLINGDYQAGLKVLAPLFYSSNGALREQQHLNILITLLARLKKRSSLKKPIPFISAESEKLDTIINAFIQKDGSSPNDAISINKGNIQSGTSTNQLKQAA